MDSNLDPQNTAQGHASYPDPISTRQDPYPALQTDQLATSAQSSVDVSPNSQFHGAQADGGLSGSRYWQHGSARMSHTHADPINHYLTDTLDESASTEPGHLSTAPPPSHLTEAQRLAQQFHVRHGDPGGAGGSPLPQALEDGGHSRSSLAGMWGEDGDGRGGGKAAASAAWRAAVTHGNNYEYDPDKDGPRDPEIEQVFKEADRVNARPRGRPPGSKSRGGYRRLLKGTEHENVGRAPRERGRRSFPRGRRKKQVDPGRQFKEHLKTANKAFVDDDLEVAADHARLAILANPEIFQAYALLSQVLSKQGQDDDAVTALKDGAHTSRTGEVWIQTAEKILEVAGENRTRERVREAIDCCSEALKLTAFLKEDPDREYEIRVMKFDLYNELNEIRFARLDCKNILAKYPMKTRFCREYAVLNAVWPDKSELNRAREAYDNAFELYKDYEVFGDEDDPTDPFSHLNIYLELVELCGDPQEGIAKCKQLARWFLGRRDETFWDLYVDDDREFDEQNDRRNLVEEFQQGRASRDISRYGQGIPIDIKVRLGMLRIKMGLPYHQEALQHFESLLQYTDAVGEYQDMFLQVAAALRGAGLLKETADFYDPVFKLPNADDIDDGLEEMVWMQFATCYQALRRNEDAIQCYEVVASHKGDCYTRACARLAKLYEDAGEMDKARFLCNELIMLNRRDLLYDASVNMVPRLNRSILPPHTRPLAMKSLRDLLPAGAIGNVDSNQDLLAQSQYDRIDSNFRRIAAWPSTHTADEDAAMPKQTKRKRKRRKDTMTANGSEGEDSGAADDADGSRIKRPRLVKTAKPRGLERARKRYQHIQDVEARSLINYMVVQKHWTAMKEGKDNDAIEEWVEAATNMLDDFQSMKVFFPENDRNFRIQASDAPDRPLVRAKALGDGKDPQLPQQFLSISFSEWHHIFSDLAMLYTTSGEQDKCYKILQDTLFAANVFCQTPQVHQASYAVAIYCGLTFNDSQYLIELGRKMISENDFRPGMPFQLLAALNRFPYGSNWFNSGPSQKFILRMVKQLDYIAMSDEIRDQIDWSAQAPGLAMKAKAFEAAGYKATEPDAGILVTYGHMVAVANHANSALPYYYRALALYPDNICINLSIATMWVQNSMKRQTSNRQFGITQGLTFLYRYYDLRVASGKVYHLQEAEYNVARMWHYIGLTHLAIPAYEKVLGLSEQVQKEAQAEAEGGWVAQSTEDFAYEAAFALQGIYAVGGNVEAAMAITEEWLVL